MCSPKSCKFSLNKSWLYFHHQHLGAATPKQLLPVFLLWSTAVPCSPTACWTNTCLCPTNCHCTVFLSCILTSQLCHTHVMPLGWRGEGSRNWIHEMNGTDWTLVMETWRKERAVPRVGVTGERINSKALLLKRNGDTETVPAVRQGSWWLQGGNGFWEQRDLGLQRREGVTWEIWACTVWAPKEETAGVGYSQHSVLLRGFPC